MLAENLADELELTNHTSSSIPHSKANILPVNKREKYREDRLNSFNAEAHCEDHPPIIGTQGINFDLI